MAHIKTGDTFSTGDVLLEIETDKAQMDVEAQDDGQMAKITVRGLVSEDRKRGMLTEPIANKWL